MSCVAKTKPRRRISPPPENDPANLERTRLRRLFTVSMDGGRAVVAGDACARERLISENVPLVYHTLERRFDHGLRNQPDLRDEAVSVGLMALIEAVDSWDPDRATLSTRAEWKIWSRVSEFLSRVKRTRAGPFRNVSFDEVEWRQDNEAHPLSERVAAIPCEEERRRLGDETDREELASLYLGYVELLPPIECEIFSRYLGLPPYTCAMSMAEVGKIYGVSSEAIRRVTSRAKRRLRGERLAPSYNTGKLYEVFETRRRAAFIELDKRTPAGEGGYAGGG